MEFTEQEILLRFGLALGLGMLIGLQRERSRSRDLAGIRTFALIALFGALAGLASNTIGAWFAVAGLLAVGGLVAAANLNRREPGHSPGPGLTTEIAVLLTYGLGVYLMIGAISIAMALGGATAFLLYAKRVLHGFVARIGAVEFKAMMQFVVIALVILPVLPDASYGPYGVLNPYEAWLMVVLIVGISLAGYLAYRLVGAGPGMLLGGFLGGLISSTATTVSYARQTRNRPALAAFAAFVIAAASTVVFARLMLEVYVVAPDIAINFLPPLAILFAVGIGFSGIAFYFATHGEVRHAPESGENPVELTAAISFGVLYVLVLLAVAFARDRFGDSGVYTVALISGLTDVDAITLSTTKMVATEKLSIATGWRTILIAALANLVFKYGAVIVLGGRPLAPRLAPYTAAMLLIGIGLIWLWPY